MGKFWKFFAVFVLFIGLVSIGGASVRLFSNQSKLDLTDLLFQDAADSIVDKADVDDGSLRYPIKEKSNNPNLEKFEQSDINLDDPDNEEYRSTYDPETNQVTIYRKVGGVDIRLPYTMSLQDYMNNDMRKSMGKYYRDKIQSEAGNSTPGTGQGFLGKALKIGGQGFESIFGANTVTIKPQGTAEISIGLKRTVIDNPSLQEKLRKTTTFDFNSKIQVNVQAAIGDKLKMGLNYNTEASFDFENQTKLEYVGKEDDIIKKIEFGNVTMPLPGTLITGSQSLFGVKTEMQFGKLNVVTLFSQQKGQTQTLNVQGGAQQQEFEVSASDYDKNRHFFLSQHFKDLFESSVANRPVVTSPIVISRIEVWVTNKSGNQDQARNIVGFTDLGESKLTNGMWTPVTGEIPSNEMNSLYSRISGTSGTRDISTVSTVLAGLGSGFRQVTDYEKIESARKLAPTEYTVNTQLGFISLNTALNNDEVLAVAYEYTYNNQTYKVGDLSTAGIEAPKVLFVKLLKATVLSPDQKTTWALMMKNIYSIGAFQVNKDDFRLDVALLSDSTGGYINYFPVGGDLIRGKRLLKVMGLDNLNQQNEPSTSGDGVFDFLEGMTIYPTNGRIIFPYLQPFGSHLKEAINDVSISKDFVYQQLYDSTITNAGQNADKNKFKLRGRYKSAQGSDISLNAMDIPEGGVSVMAGGIKLRENVDYTVDYALGRVKIINKGLLESGTPIQVSMESRSLFNMQTKTMMGTHLDYKFNPKLNIGATVMHLSERPLTTKVSIGSEPISNTMLGFNGTYVTESAALTDFLNKAPWWNLKEASSLTIDAEVAKLIPGHNKAVGKSGQSYIDDFEGTKTAIDLRNWTAWSLASTPQGQTTILPGQNVTKPLFPEGQQINDLAFGMNRARLAWYVIDPLFYTKGSLRPSHISNDDVSDQRVRQVKVDEIFPKRNTAYGQPTNLAILNLAYYPNLRGQYNYDTNNVDVTTGLLSNPADRWGGIQRAVETNDFEAANIEYIEFWMMDPRVSHHSSINEGNLYFNLGSVSEDVLRDGRKSFEQGLPISGGNTTVDSTKWGYVAAEQSVVNAFSGGSDSRFQQDIGLDGLNTAGEVNYFSSFLGNLPSEVQTKMASDPSSDDFHYFRGGDLDYQKASVLDRYKFYNNTEGNSKPSGYSPESYSTAATSIPDQEDINKDNTLSESESYYQYQVSLRGDSLKVGKNFITDSVRNTVKLANGSDGAVTWYQFRIPVNTKGRVSVNGIKDLRSIRFMRMFLKDCPDTTILRFASLDLVRGDWRQYTDKLEDLVSTPDPHTSFDLSAVNIEENSNRSPVHYVLPPGVDRVQDPANPQMRLLNEQSIALRVSNLGLGDARGAYKVLNMDIRQYKRLKMFVHAEAREDANVSSGDMTAFIRIGSDFTNNYYEYEIPLTITKQGENEAGQVWPLENEFNILLDDLESVKLARNDQKRSGIGGEYNKRFSRPDPSNGNNTIYILGSPTISNVRSVMIGIRNKMTSTNRASRSAEVWMDELRLSDFDEKGGWASNARMSLKLSDFGTISLAGATSSIGFGSIEKGVSERSQQDFYQYDVASSLELGKLMGPASRMSVPFYSSVSQAVGTPKYSPLDPDIELGVALKSANTKAEKDSIKKMSQDITTRRSLNFTNVRLQPKSDRVPVYDISNLSATYSYNETLKQNISTTYSIDKNYRGVLGYNYNARPKAIEPFAKATALNNPGLRLIRDFNFYPYPNQVSYSWEMARNYREEQLRNLSDPNEIIDLSVKKDFNFNRFFDLKYAITKNLKFDFKAVTNARIDEPEGRVDRDFRDEYQQWKNEVGNNVMNLGRTTSYQQNFNFNYTVPINKLPFMDWTSAGLRYGGMYNWIVEPSVLSNIKMGNTISNSNTIQSNGQLNFSSFYNKSSYIKSIWKKYDFDPAPKTANQATESVRFNKNGLTLEKDKPLTITHKLKTTEVVVRMFDKSGRPVNGKTNVLSPTRVEFIPEVSGDDARVMVTGTIKNENDVITVAKDISLLLLTSIKNFSITYSENNGTVLPGYTENCGFMGMSGSAPGLPFVAGWQSRDFAKTAIQHGWLTDDLSFKTPYKMVHSTDLSIKGNIEPFRGLKIELIADQRTSNSLTEYYYTDGPIGDGRNLPVTGPKNTREMGTYSMSFIAISTFKKISKSGSMESPVFNQFLANRAEISHRLPQQPNAGADTSAYAYGYGALSQDVLIPAFLSAYSGKSANSIFLNALPGISRIMPNWRISYDGIGRIRAVSKVAKNVDISHLYRCTYNVGSYSSNSINEGSSRLDLAGNYIPQYQIGVVSINEQFSPLVLVNITWVNNLTTRFENKKGRILNLGLSNNQLTENFSKEWSAGLGYRFDQLGLILNNTKITNDINIRIDYSQRDNVTVIRKILQESNDKPNQTNQLTAGMRTNSFTFTADYALNARFNIQLYYKYNKNNPYVSLSYPTTDSSYGVSFRMSLTQ